MRKPRKPNVNTEQKTPTPAVARGLARPLAKVKARNIRIFREDLEFIKRRVNPQDLPKNQRELLSAFEKFITKNNRQPTIEELALQLNTHPQTVGLVVRRMLKRV